MNHVLRLPDVSTRRVDNFIEQAPQRPGHKSGHDANSINDPFMMDFENSLLSEWRGRPPTSPRRFEVAEWAALVKRNVFPHHSDIDWDEYVEWVSKETGDEWFCEDLD